jgi:hypothetical protein
MYILRVEKLNIQKKLQLGFSSKIEILQVGSEPLLLGSAHLGKFQLEFITT